MLIGNAINTMSESKRNLTLISTILTGLKMRFILLFIIIFLPFMTKATVITIPENLIVESVNGVEQASSFFAKKTSIEVTKGDHILVLKYQDLFDGDDDHTTVRSKPFVVLFTLSSETDAKANIAVEMPMLDDVKTAKEFAKNPKVRLVGDDREEIASISESLLSFNAKEKFQQLPQSKKSHHQAVIKSKNRKTSSAMKTSNHFDVSNQNVPQLEQLKSMWQQSSKAEQDAFVHYILAQQQAALKSNK